MRPAILLVALLAVVLVPAAFAGAQSAEEDRVELRRASALLGEHLSATIRVTAPAGAVVEITPGNPSWGGVELVTTGSPSVVTRGGESVWIFDVKVAPLLPGNIVFAPTVVVVSGADVTTRTLPAIPLTVLPTLGPDDPLELTPLLPPVAIDGAESPLLRPAIAAGAALAVVLVTLLVWLLARRWARRPRRLAVPAPAVQEIPGLQTAEASIDTDPVTAYRVMSSVVKTELARRYGLRATALTSNELRRRLEDRGVDRWQARLVGGLLEECDAVIYAGYRPAAERRQADLTMAREIVEVPA